MIRHIHEVLSGSPTVLSPSESKFLKMLSEELIATITPASLSKGRVKYWMKSPKKMMVEWDRYMVTSIQDTELSKYDMPSLEAIEKLFTRLGCTISKKPK